MPIATARALIGEGGPLRQIERRCQLTSARSQILVALAITWLPLTLGSAVTEHVTGHPSALLRDSAMHVRLLVATPLLLFLDRVFPRACSHTVDQLARTGFIKPTDQDRFERLLSRVKRLSEWWLPELLLAIVALGFGIATLLVETSHGDVRTRDGLSVADWWYALVGLPLFEFLLLRSLWRWVTWVMALVGLSRLDLDLDATHPDRCGGISFLRKPSLAYCALMLFAASAVLSAAWGDRFEFVTIGSFIPLLLVFAVVATVVAFGPLLVFSLQLHRVKVAAVEAMGGLAARNGRWFRERWMDSEGGQALSAADVQGLAAIGSTYRETVKQIRLVLVERRDLVWVLLAALLPAVPSMLMQIPHDEWLSMASFLIGKGVPL